MEGCKGRNAHWTQVALCVVLSLVLVMGFLPTQAYAKTLNDDSSGWVYQDEEGTSVQTSVYTQVLGLSKGGYAAIAQKRGTDVTTDIISTSGETASFISTIWSETTSYSGMEAREINAAQNLMIMYSYDAKAYGLAKMDGTVLVEATYSTLDFVGDGSTWVVGFDWNDGTNGKLDLISTKTGKVADSYQVKYCSSYDPYCWGSYVAYKGLGPNLDNGVLLKIGKNGWSKVFDCSISEGTVSGERGVSLTATVNSSRNVWTLTETGKFTKVISGIGTSATAYFGDGCIKVEDTVYAADGTKLAWANGTLPESVGDNYLLNGILYGKAGKKIATLPAASAGQSIYYSVEGDCVVAMIGPSNSYKLTACKVYSSAGKLLRTFSLSGNSYNCAFIYDNVLGVYRFEEYGSTSSYSYYSSSMSKLPGKPLDSKINGKTLYVSDGAVYYAGGTKAKVGGYALSLPAAATTINYSFYDNARSCSAAGNTVFFAKNSEGKYGAVKADGTVVIPFEYDNYYAEADQSFAAVCKDGVWGFWQFGKASSDIAEAKASTAKSTYAYTGKAVTPNPSVTYGGKTLVKGTDYVVSYKNNVECGTATLTISGIGKYSGVKTVSFKIAKSLAKAKVSVSQSSFTYDGKAHCPSITLSYGGEKLAKGTDYTLSLPTGRKAVGSYTVTVTGKGAYFGTAKVTFKIVPKGTSVSSVKAASKGFTVTWAKQTVQTKGYQIRYSTSSTMSNAVTKTISSNTTLSYKATGLKAKTKYYVQVRTYKVVSGKKYVSGWSAARTVTTKA